LKTVGTGFFYAREKLLGLNTGWGGGE